jgi:hypothetical protein
MARASKVDCDGELYGKIAGSIQNALTGQNIFYSDSLVDLIRRHCPDVYDIAQEAGFVFVPSNDKDDLTKQPPEIWFDVVRESGLN